MAKKTEHYTGAEISLICREAVMLALEDNIDCENIGVEHLEGALKRVRRRLTWDIIAKYEQFSSSFRE
jgi:transitional endoplasmic reticulum ATPase